MLLHIPKLLLVLAHKPNYCGLRHSRLTVPGKRIDKCVLQSYFTISYTSLESSTEAQPKAIPL